MLDNKVNLDSVVGWMLGQTTAEGNVTRAGAKDKMVCGIARSQRVYGYQWRRSRYGIFKFDIVT